jgi:sister-chromatid-cohesion protein PDS5
MRLQAAVSLLQLSTVDAFANVINSNFIWLAITVQVGGHFELTRRW